MPEPDETLETRRGWALEGYDDDGVPRRLDIHIVDEWTTEDNPLNVPGRRCVLLEVTRFFLRHYQNRRKDTVVEEMETTYQGGVYVPELDAVYGAYSGIRPSRIDEETDWTWTAAADDLKKPGRGFDTLQEAIRVQTNRLARRIASAHKEAFEA